MGGLQQTIFRAGRRETLEALAFTSAQLKVEKLKAMIASGGSPLETRR
ncbi:hypothetical protein CBM2598_U10077 [Cupriavidus taiwanensis]|uniref:Uncharacterized protein n=1 Tax=Cupriavidus taiwanensis TaxID=164546 RepID=A0A7Z7JHN7_9BURK|nr:hypothetical protein CBM2597_U10273 [Cupriavidus taiwanensis]SOZ96256.1 hypothetical protein CBM2598_U10077 [Cupriavidus taiwanensis]SPC25778.1 hypothetical protein CBM2594_U10279 [Cupriavidus taiwanensis]